MNLYSHISTLVAHSKTRSYAVIDFDNTCIYNDVEEAFLAYLCEHQLLRNTHLLSTPYRHQAEYHQKVFKKYYSYIDKDEIQEAYEFAAQMLAGYSAREIQQLLDMVILFEGKKCTSQVLYGRTIARGLPIKPQTKRLLYHLQKKKIHIWFISASARVLVEHMLRHLFPKLEWRCLAIETVVQRGKYTATLIRPMTTFAGKVLCIKKSIHPTQKPLLAVGDSSNDLPMLEYAQVPVVVKRGNALEKIARQRKWFLI